MRVTERLRELFEDMTLGEPPLRITPQTAVAAGRRLIRRSRTLWTVASTALVVAAAAAVPQAWHATTPLPTALPPTGTGPTAAPTTLALQPYRLCPGQEPPPEGNSDVLPDPQTAIAALLAAATRAAPGSTFIARQAALLNDGRVNGLPHVAVGIDVGDWMGYGSLYFDIYPDAGTVERRADRGAMITSCVEGSRYKFPDGSIALYYPTGHEDTVTHIWYFAAAGFTMNIGMFPTSSSEQGLPARDSMPLATDQVMLLADAIAQAT